MTFRVGQKVVCVDAKIPSFCHAIRWMLNARWTLVHGEVYTVQRLDVCGDVPVVDLVEVKNTPASIGTCFRRDRFRPVVERKTDISIFTAMLNTSKREVEA